MSADPDLNEATVESRHVRGRMSHLPRADRRVVLRSALQLCHV